ncbi:FERM and PDZ domain-containing protein 1-like [Synchiropus splendidus]|uniref:FERM and PDZ domain-containing protein 1-like n=1 Tax=Synchiropus splendidus TaxID=270530 RepID=UPI00237D5EF1|nr:FERM and PDZ domain-containing protein 1-like [Synchiropus splendidus]XP_053713831.1 FERM and PDZ domain-containing protein 1-like [Synchiropus splendidus]XP_053713832.1 FERM and PDZ domain-containing protein 1-like [Synchiropus splendidus]
MEQDRSRSPSRRTSRVEQVVGRWLRRSRDLGSRSHSLSRDRVENKTGERGSSDQRNYPFRFSVQIQRDSNLSSHGLTLSTETPILVQDVIPGGPADGRLVPGDQLVKINNVAVDDLTPEQAAEIIRECQDTLTMTVLRTMMGPKSSFITPEKRAKLKSNPVKVRFAEEVEVNGHSQGNSLLFLPNVLKVYLENGQTKAFKFEPSTTAKDIVMTLKEKLSLSHIEHFSLVLEQQNSVSKLLLLHEEERIQQVVQKKEAHDYRCLFRVCFLPVNAQSLLREDPTAFEYLYLQGVNDVLQERFAVEMRCNTALRLAALHMQERLSSCGQSPKTNLKIITKTWGIENFVSPTLLRNMREKDLRKAIGYHMKKSVSQNDPKQKSVSVNQARINYLEELSDLKSFGGKSFSATMMLQDRESMVSLLVGARYGVSQVVNHKLSILSNLTEFTSITRIELLPETEKVSLVKIYLQDIKPITLLLESAAAKDMSCLIAGYCRVFVDPNLNVFPWPDMSQKHKVSAEEGYVSRCGSESDSSADLDMDSLITAVSRDDRPYTRTRSSSDPDRRQRKDRDRKGSRIIKEMATKTRAEARENEDKDVDTEKETLKDENFKQGINNTAQHKDETVRNENRVQMQDTATDSGSQCLTKRPTRDAERKVSSHRRVAEDQPSENSDSCQTDSHFLNSQSSDSLDALEEDDLLSCSSSSIHQKTTKSQSSMLQIHPFSHTHSETHLLSPPPAHSHPLLRLTEDNSEAESHRRLGDEAVPQLSKAFPSPTSRQCLGLSCSEDNTLCFAELSRLIDFLPSPPEASEDDEEEDNNEEELKRRREMMQVEMDNALRRASESGVIPRKGSSKGQLTSPSHPSPNMEFVFNFNQGDARCYYNLCSNITPDSARSLNSHLQEEELESDTNIAVEAIPILQPPPGFGDSSSDEEFFDANDRFTSQEDQTSEDVLRGFSKDMKQDFLSTLSLNDISVTVVDEERDANADKDGTHDYAPVDGKETLFQLRKRSRKRRSFMETAYTSTVSYPDPSLKTLSCILPNNGIDCRNDLQVTSEPEPSAQTHSLSVTVSSLIYSEGEPSQLESKPISSISGCGSQKHNPQGPNKNRKQDMEMEPESLESKSVTEHLEAGPPSINIVRCRVDPDGKESADRQGDGKEEGEGQRAIDEEEKTRLTENGIFASHFFLDLNSEGGKKHDTCHESGTSDQLVSTRSVLGTGWHISSNALSTPSTTVTDRQPVGYVTAAGPDLISKEHKLEVHSVPPSVSPPPPPPPPLSPLLPAAPQQTFQSVSSANRNKTMVAVTTSFEKKLKNLPIRTFLDSVSEDEELCDIDLELNACDEITDSSNSDNVFDDDDFTCQDVAGEELASVVDMSIISAAKGKNEQMRTEAFRRGNPDPHTDITNSGAASSVIAPSFNLDVRLKSSLPCNNFPPKLSSPTRLLVQSCSPTIMGRLSASTLHEKIINLPLYFSRSQESLNQAGLENTKEQCLGEVKDEKEITIKLTDVHDVTQTIDLRIDAEPMESDDSDATVTGSDIDGEIADKAADRFCPSQESEKMLVDVDSHPVQAEPKSHQRTEAGPNKNIPGPITRPPTSIASIFRKDSPDLDTPGPIKDAPESLMPTVKPFEHLQDFTAQSPCKPSPVVVTTQNLNGPGLLFHSHSEKCGRTSSDRPLMGFCSAAELDTDAPLTVSSSCSSMVTLCEDSPKTEGLASPSMKPESFSSALASGCESVADGVQMPLDACGCPAVYANCFSSEASFDEELTVYEFSCRSRGVTPAPGAILPLTTSSLTPSFLTTSTAHSPPCPPSLIFSPSTSELSPLLSPLSHASDCYLPQTQKEPISRLGQQRYPDCPAGFKVLRVDVDQLLSILESHLGERSEGCYGGRHPRDTCPAHFTENKRLLQMEARKLMSSCQDVVGAGQSPESILESLADSFRTLVDLSGICLWFSGCDRCDRRNAEAVSGLTDVTRSFRDFCLAAERVSNKRSCQDLSTKLLAKQCTALTASVFCLTQLFRTLTAL